MSEPVPFNWEAFWSAGFCDGGPQAPDRHLVAHYERWLEGRPAQRVFVPLCGRSYDLLWLYRQGHAVTGCELVERPVRQFFAEHALPARETPWAGGRRLATADGRLTVLQGDVLRLTAAEAGHQDAVWDVAALQDIRPQDRPRYAAVMRDLLTGDFRYLLYCTQHEHAGYAGPPYSVTRRVVEDTFGHFCRVRQLFDPEPDTEFEEGDGDGGGGEGDGAAMPEITDPSLKAAMQAMSETTFYKCMYLLTPLC